MGAFGFFQRPDGWFLIGVFVGRTNVGTAVGGTNVGEGVDVTVKAGKGVEVNTGVCACALAVKRSKTI